MLFNHNTDPDELTLYLIARLEDLQARCRSRCLASDDVRTFVTLCMRASFYSQTWGIPLSEFHVEVDSEAVAVSYGAAAHGSRLILKDGEIVAERGHARKVAHGDNGRTRLRVKYLKNTAAPDFTLYDSLTRQLGRSHGGFFLISE